jgi:hypothetical protein
VLTPDTSIVHAASAFARPAAVVGPARYAELWGPYGGLGRFVAVEGPAAAQPAAPVSAALAEVLAEVRPGAAAARR